MSMTYGDWLPTKLESIDPSDHKSICGLYQETLYAVLTHIKRLEWRQEKTTRSCHIYKSKSLTPRWRLFARISRDRQRTTPANPKRPKRTVFCGYITLVMQRLFDKILSAPDSCLRGPGTRNMGAWSSSSPKRRQHSVHQSFC